MSIFTDHALTWLTFIPLLGVLINCVVTSSFTVRVITLVTTLVVMVYGLVLCVLFAGNKAATLAYVEHYPWISLVNANYFVGLDGINAIPVVLTLLLMPVVVLAAWRNPRAGRLFFSLLLIEQTALLGVFTALNFYHWFVFYELTLVPVYFLIKYYGGTHRSDAAFKFFLYTLAGSVLLFVCYQLLHYYTGTLDFVTLGGHGIMDTIEGPLPGQDFERMVPSALAIFLFWGIFIGLAVKVPLYPLHSWLPDAYTQAPPEVVMLMTGVMSKIGIYALVRLLLPLFPELNAQFAPLVAWLAALSIIVSILVALQKKEIREVFAYSSMNHVGFCVLAFACVMGGAAVSSSDKAFALSGLFLQVFSHGITAACLFYFAGLLEERGNTVLISGFGGLRNVAPVMTGLFGVALFASIGLPGLSGFVSEFLIIRGTLPSYPWQTAVSCAGLIVTALVFLKLMERIFFGPVTPQSETIHDLTPMEKVTLIPLIFLMFAIGLFPQPLVYLAQGAIQLIEGGVGQ
ncbi:MAG: NADH-quinone oxidoreductase subunit M [Verrucomicrobiota bacterium]|nr:NADH-quinone oxidoreductase subunit M [Verrucomicrobiota bacterium]